MGWQVNTGQYRLPGPRDEKCIEQDEQDGQDEVDAGPILVILAILLDGLGRRAERDSPGWVRWD